MLPRRTASPSTTVVVDWPEAIPTVPVTADNIANPRTIPRQRSKKGPAPHLFTSTIRGSSLSTPPGSAVDTTDTLC